MHNLLFTVLFKLLPIFSAFVDFAEGNAAPLSTEESVSQFGYPFEKYKLRTEDEYTLGLERIPYSRYSDNRNVGKPVLLLHGLMLSSYIFTISNHSMSFSLSDVGYDVWLFNARGSGLSRTLSIYSNLGSAPQMNRISWNYSFHEIGIYDFTAVVDFILNKTGHPKVDIVGYSLGSTIALVGLAEKPEYNDKVNKLVLMAPTARMTSYGFPITVFDRAFPIFEYTLKNQNFFPVIQDPDATHRFLGWICSYKIFYPFCLIHFGIAQGVLVNYSQDIVVRAITDFLTPVSKKMFVHWKQLMSSKKFCKYDYGTVENIRHYNMKTPPEYNLTKVTVPVYILHSKNDRFSAVKDVKWLVNKLPNVKNVYFISTIKFGHLCFLMHVNIERLVNDKIKNALSANE